MRTALLIAGVCLAARASAQDSSAYSQLRLRASALSNPVAGAITDDWRPLLGKQLEVATPLAVGEFGIAVGRVHYKPLTGHPPYKATLITLSWLMPEQHISRARVTAGVRLSDYRMDFDDPSAGTGLGTEEEVLPGIIARGRVPLGRNFSLVADGSYGILMLSHHTPMVLLTAGGQYDVTTRSWLRNIMR